MANRGIDLAEATRLMGNPATVEFLQANGDLPLTAIRRGGEVIPLPGIPSTQLSGFCDPTRQVCPSISPFIPVPGNRQLPGGLTTDWPGLIREGIDLLFGGLGGGSVPTFQEGPLALPPGSPTPGLFPPGGLQGPLPGGTLARGGRVPFIAMPNGLPGCPSGYHPEKSGKPYCVRNRRMNPLNPRALSRATRRVGGFARAVKRARTIKQVCRSL